MPYLGVTTRGQLSFVAALLFECISRALRAGGHYMCTPRLLAGMCDPTSLCRVLMPAALFRA
jgi:hypothetical protein